MRHLPTGIEAKAATKSQFFNKQLARAMLESRVKDLELNKIKASVSADRKNQVGSGMRGDKVRTYRQQDDIVTDHRSGDKCRLRDVMNGVLPA